MSHPPRFDPDDPMLERLRSLALGFPGAQEKVSHGHPVFFTKKIFAVFGAVVKGDHYNDRHAVSVLVFPDAAEREALLEDERFFNPAYYGPWGWIGIDLGPDTDWNEIGELLDESFRNTARKGLVAELDAAAGPSDG